MRTPSEIPERAGATPGVPVVRSAAGLELAGVLQPLGGGIGKSNLVATAAPTATDDEDAGYNTLSFWYDATAGRLYICADPTAGAAVWDRLTPIKHNFTATTSPTTGDDEGDGYEVGSLWHDTTVVTPLLNPWLWFCRDASTGAADWQAVAP